MKTVKALLLLIFLPVFINCGGGSDDGSTSSTDKQPQSSVQSLIDADTDFFSIGYNLDGDPEFAKWMYVDSSGTYSEGTLLGDTDSASFLKYVQADNWNYRITHYLSYDLDNNSGDWYSSISGGTLSASIFQTSGNNKSQLIVKEFGIIKLIHNFFQYETNSTISALYEGSGSYGEANGFYAGEIVDLGSNIYQYELQHGDATTTLYGYQYPGLFKGTFSNLDEDGNEVRTGDIKIMNQSVMEKTITDVEVYTSSDGIVIKAYLEDGEGNPTDGTRADPELSFTGYNSDNGVSDRQFIYPVWTNDGWTVEAGLECILLDGAIDSGENTITVTFDGGPPWDGEYSSTYDIDYTPLKSAGDPVETSENIISVPANNFDNNWVVLYQGDDIVAKLEATERNTDGSSTVDISKSIAVLSRTIHDLAPDTVAIGYGDSNGVTAESGKVTLISAASVTSSALHIESGSPEVICPELVEASSYSDSTLNSSVSSLSAAISSTGQHQILIRYSSIAEIVPAMLDIAGSDVTLKFTSDLNQRDLAPTLITATGTIDGDEINMTGTYTDNESTTQEVSFTGIVLEDPFLIQMHYSGDGFNGTGEAFVEEIKTADPVIDDVSVFSTLYGSVLSARFLRDGQVWYPFPNLQRITITHSSGTTVYDYFYTEYNDRPDDDLPFPLADYGILTEVSDGSYGIDKDCLVSLADLDLSEFWAGNYTITFQFNFSDSTVSLNKEFYFNGDYSGSLITLEAPEINSTSGGYNIVVPDGNNIEIQFYNYRYFFGSKLKGFSTVPNSSNTIFLSSEALDCMSLSYLDVNEIGLAQLIYDGDQIVGVNYSETVSFP